ncbi:hypothetical protein R9Z33_17855 [Sediminicoccus rosea]|uniref:Uncharacterized protein n=1 Tax=Sediminicoccus rosea TaxID=1225128 RepID=A0ABZ0PEQ8_9PROT|nr:hypothetical protein [Sediminicoccus rosea]WPB83962.1 hypothetical protein R9Z33_17855 [Sediminicoccus rosea]
MRLLRQILQEERRHRALEADVQLADLSLGDRHDAHIREAHLLVEARDVLLVPADPVQGLRQHHSEAPRPGVGHKLLKARACGTRAAQGVVGVDLAHLPTLAIRPSTADPNLVLNRVLRLRV